MKRKELGYCSCCGEFLWDGKSNVETWTGVRGTVLLADGSHMCLTLCDACVGDMGFNQTWTNVLEGWLAEGAGEYAAKQYRENYILCLLHTTAWPVVLKN